jgi:hypothetical protein
MARIIEEESGTFRGSCHDHNGYYAGDFSSVAFASSGKGRTGATSWGRGFGRFQILPAPQSPRTATPNRPS